MCAICGIVSTDREYPITESTFLRMRDSMSHRGPDDAGHYIAPGIALGSLRLAILDLSERGHMPMSTMDGRYRIIHNGEIYNYRELRSGLQRQGYSFQSNTDTEVLLKLYAVEGPAMLDRLNGMFAFAIWDCEERSLFIARDRLGIKPLYYSYYKGALYFASEEKALFAAGVPLLFDHTAWEELLCFRYVAGEFTPFTDIRRLLPGHYLLWRDGQARTHRWWNLAEKVQVLRERLPEDPVSWFRETFDDSVNLRRISDVPVGVLLSGGLDSSTVAASLAEQGGHGTAAFTVRFEEVDYDEGPLARQVAVQCGLEAYELFVTPENLLERLRHAAWFNDEPQVHGNDLHLLAISEYAKSKVTVLLSGEGADELLGGYVRYQPLKHASALSIARTLIPAIRGVVNLSGRWHKLARFLQLDSLGQFVLFNACEILPCDLTSLGLASSPQFTFRADVLKEARSLYPEDLARQAMYSDQHTFLCSVLDRNDRMTMGASIECRVPFLDYRLVEMLAALPSSVLFRGRKSKGLLRAALGSRLPSSILRHRKWGFGVPWKQYLRQVPELRVLLSDLPNNQLIMQSPLRRAVLEEQVEDFLDGVDQPFPLLMQLLMTTLSWESVNRLQCRTLKAANAASVDVLDTSNAV